MDPTSAVRTDALPAIATVIAPGAIVSASYGWWALERMPNVRAFMTEHEAMGVGFALLVWVSAGFVVDSMGSYVEFYLIDQRRKDSKDALNEWWNYLRITWGEREPIGQRYLRRLLVTFKFELNMCVAVVSSLPGVILLAVTGHLTPRASLIVGMLMLALAVALFKFASDSADVLVKVRRELLKAAPQR